LKIEYREVLVLREYQDLSYQSPRDRIRRSVEVVQGAKGAARGVEAVLRGKEVT
jgi:hypothetical protein